MAECGSRRHHFDGRGRHYCATALTAAGAAGERPCSGGGRCFRRREAARPGAARKRDRDSAEEAGRSGCVSRGRSWNRRDGARYPAGPLKRGGVSLRNRANAWQHSVGRKIEGLPDGSDLPVEPPGHPTSTNRGLGRLLCTRESRSTLARRIACLANRAGDCNTRRSRSAACWRSWQVFTKTAFQTIAVEGD